MKTVILLSFVGSALAHPKGLWWGTDLCYPSPEKTDNYCLGHQKAGFDWSQLANGDNWSYEGFNFVGFSPSDACGASGGKCIEAQLSRDDTYAVRIEANQAPFSVQKFHLSTSRDTLVMMNYEMPDGSSCHQITSSTPEGVDFVNQQCGGAVSVEFTLPEDSKFGECDLNIHQMDFDCTPGEKPPGHLPPPESSSEPPHSIPIRSSTTLEVVPSSVEVTPSASSPTVWTHPAITSDVHTITPKVSTIWTTVEITVTNCAPTVTNCPSHSTVTSTHTVSTTTACSSSSVISSPTSAGPVSTSPAVPDTPVVPAPCPEVLPKCINTWLGIPKCASNSDAACFCPSTDFTHKVESCINAWGASEKEKSWALSYFAGICAPYIPQNPDVISLVPTTPKPTAPVHDSSVVPQPPVTPASPEPKPPCTTITWSSQTMTVPQVAFSTIPAGSTTSVALIVPPSFTSAGPVSSTSSCSSSKTITSVTTSTCKTSSFQTVPTTKVVVTVPAPTPTETAIFSNAASKLPLQNILSAAAALFVLFVTV